METNRVGSYQVVERIREGGTGEVFRAQDLKLGRTVALKVLPRHFAEDSDRMAGFRREAQILAALNHPNIASIYGVGESNDTTFLALDRQEGRCLS